jgi:hypothetical protein
MTMGNTSTTWRELFRAWPSGAQKRGVVVTAFGEQIAFNGFRDSDSLLMVERQAPDTMGSRSVIMPYEQISAVKITEVFKSEVFEAWGLGRRASSSKHEPVEV